MLFPRHITNLDEYIAFIERRLGSEVQGDIQLTMDNFLDIITISMKEFFRYFQAESLRKKTYVIEIQSGKDEYKVEDLMMYSRASSFGEYKLTPVQPEIFQVLELAEFNTNMSFMNMSGTGDVNYEYLFYFNGNSGSGMVGMEKAQMAIDQMRNADYIRKLFQKKYYAEFDRDSETLKITPTPRQDGFTAITVAEYKQFEEIVNNELFWKLTEANAKKQWTANFMMYDDISINGGGKTDFKSIRAEGKEEWLEVKQDMEDMREPLMFFVD